MSSHDTKNPSGGVNMGHVMETSDPNDHLLERIISQENMLKAWKRVKANKGASGIDNMSIEDFPEFARKNRDNIRESLMAGIYQPSPVRRVEIPKATGGTRPPGIPTVLDRLIQQAICQVLMPVFDPDFNGTKIRWSDKALREFKRRVKELTGRSWFVSMEYRFNKLAQYLRGWTNYFGISEYYSPIPQIDHWLRRRVRMCYWKQWRYARTKVRELRKLGTFLDAAISVAMSRKGPWHLARTPATQSGMTNQWLMDQGLLSVKELWVNIHYPATVR